MSKNRSARHAHRLPPSPSASVCSSSILEDDVISSVTASPRRGRKESEQRRRVMMNQYFDELVTLLSMVSEKIIPKKMDKTTTLREAVRCVQTYSDLTKGGSKPPALTVDSQVSGKMKSSPTSGAASMDTAHTAAVYPGLLDPGEMFHFFLDAHDAFMIVFSESGRILYSTELVTSLLGHMQTRLVGQNIYEYIQSNDHAQVKDLFAVNPSLGVELPQSPLITHPASKSFDCHMKLYSGETGVHPQYLPFVCISYLRQWKQGCAYNVSPPSPDEEDELIFSNEDSSNKKACIILLAKLPTSVTLVDLAVGTNDVNFEFDLRVSREGHIVDVNKHAILIFGFTISELIGTSFFEYIDPYHIVEVGESMSTFLNNGLGVTTPYRMRTKGGRYIWLISKGYLSYDPWNNKPDHILLTNRVLSCDQVLPEHRFFRSHKLLPDLECKEDYEPSSLQMPQVDNSSGTTQAPKLCLKDIARAPAPYLVSSSRQTPKPGSLPNVFGSVSPSIPVPVSSGNNTMNQIGNMPQHMSELCTLVAEAGSQSASSNPAQQKGGTDGKDSSQLQIPQAILDFQKKLEVKNIQLLEMQSKLLEQQQMFEKERTEFLQVTQQVMQCIGGGPSAHVPASMSTPVTLEAALSGVSQDVGKCLDSSAISLQQQIGMGQSSLGTTLQGTCMSQTTTGPSLMGPGGPIYSSQNWTNPSAFDGFSTIQHHQRHTHLPQGYLSSQQMPTTPFPNMSISSSGSPSVFDNRGYQSSMMSSTSAGGEIVSATNPLGLSSPFFRSHSHIQTHNAQYQQQAIEQKITTLLAQHSALVSQQQQSQHGHTTQSSSAHLPLPTQYYQTQAPSLSYTMTGMAGGGSGAFSSSNRLPGGTGSTTSSTSSCGFDLNQLLSSSALSPLDNASTSKNQQLFPQNLSDLLNSVSYTYSSS